MTKFDSVKFTCVLKDKLNIQVRSDLSINTILECKELLTGNLQ